jgi:hypothetical protein
MDVQMLVTPEDFQLAVAFPLVLVTRCNCRAEGGAMHARISFANCSKRDESCQYSAAILSTAGGE